METTLITGASSGIGKATAFEYAKNNYNLVLVARRKELLEEIKTQIEKEHQVSVTVIDMDLAQLDATEKISNILIEKDIEIDVLINNAGFGEYGEFLYNDIEKIESMLMLNIITLTKLTHHFAMVMANLDKGHIINIASTAAFQPVPYLAAYAASKSYVMNFSDAIAHEYKEHNVHIMSVSPGATQSEFGKVAGFGEDAAFFNKMPSSEDLAKFIYKSMKQGKTNVIHGFKNKIMAFSNRFAPRKMTTYIAALMMK